jgi:hypothetical protein
MILVIGLNPSLKVFKVYNAPILTEIPESSDLKCDSDNKGVDGEAIFLQNKGVDETTEPSLRYALTKTNVFFPKGKTELGKLICVIGWSLSSRASKIFSTIGVVADVSLDKTVYLTTVSEPKLFQAKLSLTTDGCCV